MKRKKQGASLIVVIIIFMFVSTVSMAMLSMIVGNYKARISESRRMENLYASDSGLDVAYNVIGKTFDAATKYGYYKVETLKDGSNKGSNNPKYQDIEDDIQSLEHDIDTLEEEKNDEDADINRINREIIKKRGLIEEDEKMKEILLNEEFKRAFKNFIKRTSEYTTDEKIPESLLKDSIEAHQYVTKEFSEENIDNGIFNKETIKFSSIDVAPKPVLEAEISDPKNIEGREETEDPYPRKSGHSTDVQGLRISKSMDQEYEPEVTSTFYTETTNGDGSRTNERKLKVKFKMSVPNYKDIFFENATGDLHEYLALNDRALTVGGDMNVGSETSTYQTKLTVDKGDIFVNGITDNSTNDRVYGKYLGGIKLNNSDSVLFNKNVITRGTFNIQNKTASIIKGDLYARNIYAGNLNGTHSNNSNLTTEKVVIDNDLTLKATSTHVVIKDFYGINDKNIKYKDDIRNGDSNPSEKARTSSSIIINDTESDQTGSSVRIENDAYIMGTAHIDTRENNGINAGYQTGESTAVKGNYEAYSVPLNEAEKFDYYDPLQLLDESNVFTKGEHFKKYWNEVMPNKVDQGGIYFEKPENIHSVGAVILYDSSTKKKVVVSANYGLNEDDEVNINEKRIDFASKVYKFGQEPENDAERVSMLEMYNSLGTGAIGVDSLMNFSENFPEDYNLENDDEYSLDDEISSSGEKAIFNSSAKTIVITDKTEDYDDTDEYIVIDASDGEVNGVIATLDDVIIDGDITFNGTIITEGDLTITGNVVINYDSDVIERVQAENSNLFYSVFGDNISEREENTNDSENQEVLATKYDLQNFLEKKLWKIIK